MKTNKKIKGMERLMKCSSHFNQSNLVVYGFQLYSYFQRDTQTKGELIKENMKRL